MTSRSTTYEHIDMSQPHHFVFNELSRAISKDVPLEPLIDGLIKKNVIKESDKGRYKKRNGMNTLIAYLRNRDFDTFVHLVECIWDLHQEKPSMSRLVTSIREAVKTYDEKNSTSFSQRISFGKEKTSLQAPAEAGEQTQVLATHVEGATALAEEFSTQQLKVEKKHLAAKPTSMEEMPGLLEHSVQKEVIDSSGKTISSFLYGYKITIPEGAVQEGKSISLQVGICTHGPYALHKDGERITDFLCVFADGDFQSPVTVCLDHCLELSDYKQTSGIAIMRADMDEIDENGKYIFKKLTCTPEISDQESTLSFKLSKFCVLCSQYFPHDRHLERQGSSTDSHDSKAARLVKQVRIDDSSSGHATSPQSSFEEQDGPYRLRGGSGSLPSAKKPSTDEEESHMMTSSGETSSPRGKRKKSSLKRRQPPYKRSSVKYRLLLYEPKQISSLSFDVHIYACLDCPGSMQACKIQSQEYKVSSSYVFDFKSENIQFEQLHSTQGWLVKPKVSPMTVSKSEIQRKMTPEEAVMLVEMEQYPPRKVLNVTWCAAQSSSYPIASSVVCDVRVTDPKSNSDVCTFAITVPPLPFSTTGSPYPSIPMPGQPGVPHQPQHYYSTPQPLQNYSYQTPLAGPPIAGHPTAALHGEMHPTMYHPPPAMNTMVAHTHPTNAAMETVPGYCQNYSSEVQPLTAYTGAADNSLQLPPPPTQTSRLNRSLSNEEKEALLKQVDQKVFLKICYHIKEWRMLARHLGIDEATVCQLEYDYKNDCKEATYQMLTYWGKTNDGETTFQTLLEALKNGNEDQAIEYLYDNLLDLSNNN